MTSSLLIFFFLAVLYVPLPAESTRYNYIDSSRFNLRDNQTDVCYSEKTLTARADCLQSLIEYYYGHYFTRSCPDFPEILAHWDCRECPWSRLNLSSIPTLSETDVLVFPGIKPSCTIARHVYVYSSHVSVANRVMVPAIIGSLLLAFCILLLSTDDIPVQFFSYSIPEPLFLFLVWSAYDFGFLLLLYSQDHNYVCDSVTSVLTQQVADGVSSAIMIYYVLWRCARLKVGNMECKVSSWYSFVRPTDEFNPHQMRKKTFFRMCYSIAPVILAASFVLDYVTTFTYGRRWKYLDGRTECFYGDRNVSIGAIQYSKLILELLSITIYAFGPSKIRWRFGLRFFSLCFILVCSIIIGIVQLDPTIYNLSSISTTFPRVLDADVAGTFTELSLVSVISLMGILEPFRIGLPTDDKYFRCDGDQCCRLSLHLLSAK